MTGTRVCARLKGLLEPHHGVLHQAVVLAPLPSQVSADSTSQRVGKPQKWFLPRPGETIAEVLRGDLRLLRGDDRASVLGIVRCLSLTGGSVLLVKGSFPVGTLGELALGTIFGKVRAHVEFLQLGADGVSRAQAFRFVAMDDVSTKRFNAAVKQMQMAGFSDVVEQKPTLIETALESWNKLRDNFRLSGRGT